MTKMLKNTVLALGLSSAGLFSANAFAKGGGGGGGGIRIGADFGIVTVGQDDLNTLQQRANTRTGAGPITASQLGSAYEISGSFGYRFAGSMYEIIFRPSYFWQSSEGTGSDGSYKYGMTGFALTPTFRLYPLENEFMRFFFQVGVNYGKLYGSITEGSFSTEFSGGSFGYSAGLGVELCFTSAHCMTLEGNLRGLAAERVLVTAISGTAATSTAGIDSGMAVGKELEMDGRDVKLSGSGIVALIGYSMHF